MAEPTSTLLEEVLGQVLQDAAFVFAEPAEEPEAWGSPLYAVKLAFESVRGGELRLTAGRGAAVEIAANMLGLDASDPEAAEQGRAALGELLNVIGGAFVTRFFGTKVPSQLGLPIVDEVGAPVAGPRTCAAAVRTETGEPVLLELDLEGAAAI
jgi:hypothetical protein